jgi:hypothetical protein
LPNPAIEIYNVEAEVGSKFPGNRAKVSQINDRRNSRFGQKFPENVCPNSAIDICNVEAEVGSKFPGKEQKKFDVNDATKMKF